MERDVHIPSRIAAKACGAMAEDTAVLVMELGVRARQMCNAAKARGAMAEDTAGLALLGTNPVLQIRLAAKVSCVPPTVRVIPAWQ